MAIPHVPEAPPPVLVGASLAISAFTKAVVASCVVFVPTEAVGAVGVPVKAGESSDPALAMTKAVVAIWVVFVPSVAVGAVGVPVSAGEARGALVAASSFRLVKLASTSVCVRGEPFPARVTMVAIYSTY
jgi:hypothetical protein